MGPTANVAARSRVAPTRPAVDLDAAGLRAAVDATGRPDVVMAEPYLAGTSARLVADALADRPHRPVGLGVRDAELRLDGTPEDHLAAQGLDAAGVRRSLDLTLGR